jgi:hypothetical protein
MVVLLSVVVCGMMQGSHFGAQTVRRGGVGPVRSLLGGKPHRPLFSIRHHVFRIGAAEVRFR